MAKGKASRPFWAEWLIGCAKFVGIGGGLLGLIFGVSTVVQHFPSVGDMIACGLIVVCVGFCGFMIAVHKSE